MVEDVLDADNNDERVNQCLDELEELIDSPESPPFDFRRLPAATNHSDRMVVFLPSGYYLSYTVRPDGIAPTHQGPCVVVRVLALI